MNKKKILIIDDEDPFRYVLKFNLEQRGYEALEASIVVDEPKEEDVLVASVIGEQVNEEVYVQEAPEASHGNLRSDDFYVSDEM